MELLILLCIALLAVCGVLVGRLLTIKQQLRVIREELIRTRDKSYNRQITVALVDNDLSEMTSTINENLDYQKTLKYETQQAERTIKQSVSDIAHDLRTPLTVIKGNLQMLEREEQLSDKGREYLRICGEKSDAMKSMADEFFELSLLESDTSAATLSKINATNMLMQFIVDNEAVIRGQSLEPDIQFPEKSVFILADEQLLIRMLSNLLNNVVKYATDEFTIRVIGGEERCSIVFSNAVGDRGIDPELLFQRTYMGDKARSGNGAGLGLYIVKLLAEKQQAIAKASVENGILSIDISFLAASSRIRSSQT